MQTDFPVIMIDQETEQALGTFPLDRKYLAQAIDRLAELGAKAVVLKFFIDLPGKTEKSDRLLAQAMTRLPVILQARIDSSETHPNSLPVRDTLQLESTNAFELFHGRHGWIPAPAFAEVADGIGFIDGGNPVYMLERYQGKVVKSLYVLALEKMLDQRAEFKFDRVVFSTASLRLNRQAGIRLRWPENGNFPTISMLSLLHRQVPAEAIRGKVVVLGYDGAKMHRIDTPHGSIKAHRLFCLFLQQLKERLSNQSTGANSG